MLKKLQKKFIMINMALVSIVLLIVFVALFISTDQKWQFQHHEALKKAIDQRPDIPPKFDFPNGDIHKRSPFASTVCILLNDEQEILSITENGLSISDELLQQAVAQIISDDKPEGSLYQSSLLYLKRETPEGIKIAFTDRSSELLALRSLLATSAVVGLSSLIAFFLISLFLSRWALKPVEQAWSRQRQFVADASHELKTPLTVILANTDILLSQSQGSSSPNLKWIENTKEEASRMKCLLEDMLFLAKSDADRTAPEPFFFNLSDTVWNCLLAFESVAFEQGVTIESHIQPDLFMKGSEHQIKQLLMILLDNACKYSESHHHTNTSPVVFLSLTVQHSALHLTVNNTGIPIPKEDLPHLFERFYRADKSRARRHGGFGLGLPIAKSIVTCHHGAITVTSDEKSGTCFFIRFPYEENHSK